MGSDVQVDADRVIELLALQVAGLSRQVAVQTARVDQLEAEKVELLAAAEESRDA